MNKTVKIIISVVICLMVGFVGSVFTTPAIKSWYVTLNKPSFNPPNWLFAPVWTLLFILMGIAAGIIWNKGINKKLVKPALTIFTIQLILNVIWSIIFFGLKSPLFAFIEIIFLWLAIFITIKKFFKINKTAGSLLIPYILWVTFASFLNLNILLLNL